MNKKIAIIGGGNLGTAIAEGLIQSGFVQPKHILITKRNIHTLHELERGGYWSVIKMKRPSGMRTW